MTEKLLAVTKIINPVNSAPVVSTTKTENNFFGDFFATTSLPPVELLFRGLRVVSVVFAIVFINILLVGAMKYVIASGRDDAVRECRGKVVMGGIGTMVAFFLYYFASVALLKIENGG